VSRGNCYPALLGRAVVVGLLPEGLLLELWADRGTISVLHPVTQLLAVSTARLALLAARAVSTGGGHLVKVVSVKSFVCLFD